MTIKTSSMRTRKPAVMDKGLLQVLPAEVDEFALDLVRLLKRAGVWEPLPKRQTPSPEVASTTPRHCRARQTPPARRCPIAGNWRGNERVRQSTETVCNPLQKEEATCSMNK